MKKLYLVCGLLLFCLVQVSSAVNINTGTATGSIKLDGKEYPIKYSYALGVGEQYWLLLTDASVPPESFEGPRKIRSLAIDGKTHGLLMTVDSKGNANPIMIFQVTEATGDLSWQKLDFSKLSKETLEGKTSTVSQQKFQDKTYEYDITFKAPVNVMK